MEERGFETVGGSGEDGGRAWEQSYLLLSYVVNKFCFLETTLEIVLRREVGEEVVANVG